MADSTGMADLRAEYVSKTVAGFALAKYKFKQFCLVQSSSVWKETYFQETAADLTGGTGSAVKGVPRLAAFPEASVTWTEQSKRNAKYGIEETISLEDKKTNDVDVISRTLLRIARAITKAVDAEIWDVISESQSASNINSLTISAGKEWNATEIANRDPIQNLLDAKVEISDNDYDPEGAYLLLSPKDYANLLGNANVRNAGQFYTDSVTKKGKVGEIVGLNIIVSNNVTADYALIIIKNSATWKSVQGLTTVTKEDPGIDTKIRSWEIGCCQLKEPKGICLISNTQKS